MDWNRRASDEALCWSASFSSALQLTLIVKRAQVAKLTRELHVKNGTKIVMLVADGLGGLPLEAGGKTELETANTPNLDALAKRGVQGGSIPVKPGISPGSGPGHLGLFGYDPLQYRIGRGALEATGIGFEIGPNDVAIRANFCTLDASGSWPALRACT